jgi:uncharacterized protein YecE (DUF72 family)
LPHDRELGFLADQLDSVEVNGTFYSLTRPSACKRWRESVRPSFVFAIKGSRYITHMLKLNNFEGPLANFFASGILLLGRTLGPILWQLPPQLPFQRDRAVRFFVAAAQRWARHHDQRTTGRAALHAPDGQDARLVHVVEVRHPSWMEPEALRTLRDLDVALVFADTAGRYPSPDQRTGDVVYVRLHGSTRLYASRYSDHELAGWAARAAAWSAGGTDVYVYFDNDAEGHAPHDALRLKAAVRRRLPHRTGDEQAGVEGQGGGPW